MDTAVAGTVLAFLVIAVGIPVAVFVHFVGELTRDIRRAGRI